MTDTHGRNDRQRNYNELLQSGAGTKRKKNEILSVQKKRRRGRFFSITFICLFSALSLSLSLSDCLVFVLKLRKSKLKNSNAFVIDFQKFHAIEMKSKFLFLYINVYDGIKWNHDVTVTYVPTRDVICIYWNVIKVKRNNCQCFFTPLLW